MYVQMVSSEISGLSLEAPGSPSLTSALSGLVGQNYLQLLQALQQQQQGMVVLL